MRSDRSNGYWRGKNTLSYKSSLMPPPGSLRWLGMPYCINL